MSEPFVHLLFIYNADSGALALLRDVALKLIGRGDCALCDLTHGPTGERTQWAACQRELPVPVELLHRDELDAAQRAVLRGALPAVIGVRPSGIEVLLGPTEIGQCADITELVAKLRERL
ncbi:MAG: hypothetical protein OXT09_32725 [Myxococcales bacterium]|nr:hypothetical protein [Myxococcales bacterium]